jgi:hypothetical protein
MATRKTNALAKQETAEMEVLPIETTGQLALPVEIIDEIRIILQEEPRYNRLTHVELASLAITRIRERAMMVGMQHPVREGVPATVNVTKAPLIQLNFTQRNTNTTHVEGDLLSEGSTKTTSKVSSFIKNSVPDFRDWSGLSGAANVLWASIITIISVSSFFILAQAIRPTTNKLLPASQTPYPSEVEPAYVLPTETYRTN